ncbi:HD domain-containing protein [Pyruvatibacter mobilis]|uniref:HD domain-containing protein n=1 Tax=Pyruvatibacter mobilis TaxID=1712261 RepID=UPI003D14605F
MGDKFRLRDAVHGLIGFGDSEPDRTAVQCLSAPEFQRLRRIKQLGFSEFVFDGAAHTRFAHSVGVFHTARKILDLIRSLDLGGEEERVHEAALGALLHDVGHGPFSHTFEQVQKKTNPKKRKKHEKWSGEIICGSNTIVNALGLNRAESISDMLRRDEPLDIYDSVVSSQFDADRLDYLIRDRYMTGVQFGAVDLEWLLDNLRVSEVPVSAPSDDSDGSLAPGFYLDIKGFRAAEEYLLARYHLYEQVYLHKTTRGAEQMLQELLFRFAQLAQANDAHTLNVSRSNPLFVFFSTDDPSLGEYLSLDDTVIWATLQDLKSAKEETIADLAERLLTRNLYKCFDIGREAQNHANKAAIARFLPRFEQLRSEQEHHKFLIDDAELSPYKLKGFDEPGALQKVLVNVRGSEPPYLSDIADESPIINALKTKPVKLVRVYGPTHESLQQVRELWQEVAG